MMATVANDSTLRSLCIYNPELSTKEGTVNLLLVLMDRSSNNVGPHELAGSSL